VFFTRKKGIRHFIPQKKAIFTNNKIFYSPKTIKLWQAEDY